TRSVFLHSGFQTATLRCSFRVFLSWEISHWRWLIGVTSKLRGRKSERLLQDQSPRPQQPPAPQKRFDVSRKRAPLFALPLARATQSFPLRRCIDLPLTHACRVLLRIRRAPADAIAIADIVRDRRRRGGRAEYVRHRRNPSRVERC